MPRRSIRSSASGRGHRGGATRAERPRCRIRRAGASVRRCPAAAGARRSRPARTGTAIPARRAARRDRRPRRSAAARRSRRSSRRPRPAPRSPRRGRNSPACRRGCGRAHSRGRAATLARPSTRGATRPTCGSSKWSSNGSSQPSGRSTSASTNATSAVSTKERAAWRAAAGPRLTGRRSVAPTSGGTEPSSIDDSPVSRHRAAELRGDDRDVAPGDPTRWRATLRRVMRRTTGGSRRRRAGGRRAVTASTGSPRSIASRVSAPRRGDAEDAQRRPGDQHPVEALPRPVDDEPPPDQSAHQRSSAGRQRCGVGSIGRHFSISWTRSSTNVEMNRSPSPPDAPSGSPSTPDGLTARTPARRSSSMRRVGAGLGQLEADQPGVDRQHQRRLDPSRMEVVRATVVALGPLRPPRQRVATLPGQRGHGVGDGAVVAAVPVDEHDAGRPVGAADQFDARPSSSPRARSTGCRRIPRARPTTPTEIVGPTIRPSVWWIARPAISSAISVSVASGQVRAVLFGRAHRDQHDRRLSTPSTVRSGPIVVGDLAPRARRPGARQPAVPAAVAGSCR